MNSQFPKPQNQNQNSSAIQEIALRQLNQDNSELKLQVADLKKQNENYQQTAASAIELKQKYDKMHHEHHQLQQLLKKRDDNSLILENRIKELDLMTKDLQEYQSLKDNSVTIQLRNIELQSELEEFKKKQIFSVKRSVKSENGKNYLTVRLDWNRNIQNLQLTYRLENDLLILEGYGELENKKVVYSQQVELERKVAQQIDRPNISIKNSTMTLIFGQMN